MVFPDPLSRPALDKYLGNRKKLDGVILIDVPSEFIFDRMTGREAVPCVVLAITLSIILLQGRVNVMYVVM